jgi:uncharacterized RDD family membrane protein YckC
VAKLIVNPTSANRREIVLSRSMILTIGRDPSNDLVLADSMVSRRHAVVEHRGSQFFLRDCNSVNGSVVNGDRVGERALRDGDLLAVGAMRLLFRDDPAEAPGPGKVVQHPSSAPLACPSCGAAYRRGDLFCRECGVQVAQPSGPPRAVCTACGTAVPLPARFCSACGATLTPSGERLAEPDAAPPASPRDTLTSPPAGVTGPIAAGSMAMAARAENAPVATAPDVTPLGLPLRGRPDRGPARARAAGPPASLAGARLFAAAIDAVFVLAAQAVILAPVAWYWWTREAPRAPGDVPFLPVLASVTLVPLAALVGALYHVYFWTRTGATPGKELLGLRVEDEEGRCPIGAGRAALRALGYVLGVASLGVGFAMAASAGGALHDRVAGTRVARAPRR